MTGPLTGVRVLEIVGLGPGPFCGMVLADLGASVLQVDRVGSRPAGMGMLNRGKHAIELDLKSPEGVAAFLDLAADADVVIDVWRPGVAERLGVGPEACAERNPGLVFARLTGWGQTGEWADRAGHDLNYLALSGVLDLLGPADGKPQAPINLLADFAGGALYCVIGIVSALFERTVSGRGQVVDAAMVDGAAQLAGPFFAGRTNGGWGPRGTNLLDGAAPFYDVYRCSCGGWLSIGAIEPQFFAALVEGLGIDLDPADQWTMDAWPGQHDRIAEVVAGRTLAEWTATFDGVDACVAPVVPTEDAPASPHAASRGAFVTGADDLPEPRPAPRFSRTDGEAGPPLPDAEDHDDAIAAWLGATREDHR